MYLWDDAKTVVDAIKELKGCAYFHTIVEDCVELLKHFDNVLVEFVRRSANEAAHKLAREAHSMSGVQEWGVDDCRSELYFWCIDYWFSLMKSKCVFVKKKKIGNKGVDNHGQCIAHTFSNE